MSLRKLQNMHPLLLTPAAAPPVSAAGRNSSSASRKCFEKPTVNQESVLALGSFFGGLSLRSYTRRRKCRLRKRKVASAAFSNLPPSACWGQVAGTNVVIIGTTHISLKSAEEVEELIKLLKPDSIVIELSRDRISSLQPAPLEGTASPLKLRLSQTSKGFLEVSEQEELPETSENAGKIILAGPEPGKFSEVKMRPVLTSYSDTEWFEKALKKHRYVSSSYQLWPAIEFLVAAFQAIIPRAQRMIYVSLFAVKQSGLEFASAARCARQLGCPVILGDVEDSDGLFDPVRALSATRADPVYVRLAGPLVRPSETSGIDFGKALQHVFGEFASNQVFERTILFIAGLLLYGVVSDGYLSGDAKPADLAPLWMALAACLLWPLIIVSVLSFLLTAARDEELFGALAEAAEESTKRGGPGGTVVLVCGLAHVNGIARKVAKWEAA